MNIPLRRQHGWLHQQNWHYYQVTLHSPQKFSDLKDEDGFYVNKTDAQDLIDLFIEILGHKGGRRIPSETMDFDPKIPGNQLVR